MLLPSGWSTRDYSVKADSKGWGPGWPTCTALNNNTVRIQLQRSGTILYQINRSIAPLVAYLANETERRGYMFTPGECWGGECRSIAGTNRASNHSWGLAFDLNAPRNPYTSSGQHDIPDWVFALWRAYGFGVGADYSGKKDWMHFEFMGTPTDAAMMVLLAARAFGPGASNPTPTPDPAPPVNKPKPIPATGGNPYVSKRGKRKPVFPLRTQRVTWFGIDGNNSVRYCRMWQQYLADSGYKVTVDGKWGPQTVAATKAWQTKYVGGNVYQANGRLNQLTWNRAGLRVV